MRNDQTIDIAKPPKIWRYVVSALLAAILVLGYAYLSWTSVSASSILPTIIQDEINWVSEDKSVADSPSAISPRKSDLRERLLDLRGKLGDSFGPVNALLSSFGFIALLYSINLQRAISTEQARVQQESITNQEIAAKQQEKLQQRQRFEELLSITIAANRSALNDVSWQIWVKAWDWKPPEKKSRQFNLSDAMDPESFRPSVPASMLTGKKALYTIWQNDVEDKFRKTVSEHTEYNALAKEIAIRYVELDDWSSTSEGEKAKIPHYIRLSFDQSDWSLRQQIFNRIRKTYYEMYREHEHQLDAYFRTLYRIFELLSRGETDYGLDNKQVREYAAIARAQLSWQELAFVLLNCCAANFEKAGRLYSYFALFDNLADRSSIVTTLLRKYVEADKEGAGYLSKPEALSELTHHTFNTDKARTLPLPPKHEGSPIADASLVQPSTLRP
jgi:hypothetical protein